MPHPIVRAIDVGYGEVKFSEGCDPQTKAIRTDSFPKHSVILLEEPAFANVRGFHAIGEKLAHSAQRAASLKEPVNHA